MIELGGKQCWQAGAIRAWWLVSACVFVSMLGCAQKAFQANALPPKYWAAPTQNINTIDLSTLGGFSERSDLIGRGDVLDVSIATGYDRTDGISAPVRVDEQGNANISLVGSVPLAGLRPDAAQNAIAAAAIARGIYRQPNVTVSMKQRCVNKVTIIGAVLKPGIYELPQYNSSLLPALVAAGGLSQEAGTEVEIRRSKLQARAADYPQSGTQLASYTAEGPPLPPPSLRVDLSTLNEENSEGYYLADGDVVMVEQRDFEPIHVMGLVRKSGQYKLPINQELRVLDAIALAGERSTPWADRVIVIRKVPVGEPVVIYLSLRDAKKYGHSNLQLAPGDVVSVEPSFATVLYDAGRFIRFNIGGSYNVF